MPSFAVRRSLAAAVMCLVGISGCALSKHCKELKPGAEGGYCATSEEDAAFWEKQVWRERYMGN